MAAKIFALLVGGFAMAVPAVLLWRHIGWKRMSAVVLAFAAIDLDHFILTNQAGFLQEPQSGQVILRAFHGIEFLVIVLVINLSDTRWRQSLAVWLFPTQASYPRVWDLALAWAARALLFGVGLHYFMDAIIYTLMGKWGYYDYSVVHYLFTSGK